MFYPLLLTPQFQGKKFTGYVKERMAEALQPRLYHNVALLLPDASILLSGGNSARATVHSSFIPPADPNQSVQPKPDLGQVELDVYFYDDGPMAKVKRITVDPGQRLSYQRHHRRREHWFVVAGTALVTLDDTDHEVGVGESIDIPLGAAHRVTNKGDEPLVFVEVQQGDYFGEDDIVRLDDDYGRADA